MSERIQITLAVLVSVAAIAATFITVGMSIREEPLRLPTEVTTPSWTPFTRIPRSPHSSTAYYPPGYVASPGR